MRFTITANHGRYSWTIPVPIFEVKKNGFQTLTIPVSGNFNIQIASPVHRVKNSRAIAPGIRCDGTFLLKKGQKITVMLGQKFIPQQSRNKLSRFRSFHRSLSRSLADGTAQRVLNVGTDVLELFSRRNFWDDRQSLGESLCVMEGEHGPEPLLIVGSEGNFSTDSYSKFGLHFGNYEYCKIQRQEN